MIRLGLLLVSSGWMLAGAEAVSVDFQHSGGSAARWDFLDLRGDAEITPATDPSCPPGYGPEVLRIKGTLLLGMVKGLELIDGTIIALYRENDVRDADADGIILFWSAYPQDIAEAHNTKQWLPHVWLEQDNDSGFQFRYAKENAEENTLAERSGYGIVTDPWNRTDWIWQKVQIEGNRVRAKYWPAHLAEPEDWAIEAESNRPVGPRFGIKVNSGDIHLAYLAADAGDIAVEPPKAWLYFPFPYATQTRTIPFTLFTNSPEAAAESFTLTVKTDETELESQPVSLELAQGPGETHVVAVSPEGKPESRGTVFALPAEPGAGTVTVTLTGTSGKFDAERRVEVRPATELQKRMNAVADAVRMLNEVLATVEQRTERVAALEVIRDATQAHLEHARTRLAAAKVKDADLSLRFAVGALAELDGYKGGWFDELSPGAALPELGAVKADDRGIGEAEHGVSDCYSNDYLIRFDRPQMTANSFVMGRSYEVTIPWQVEGISPDRDYAFSVQLVSPLGKRVVAQSSAAPTVPTSQWQPGEIYPQTVTLDVLAENPNPDGPPQAQPPVLDEMHRLLVTVSDPATDARLLLGNPPGPQPDRPGSSYLVDNVYVSSNPFEIRQFSPEDGAVLIERNESMTVVNTGEAERSATILVSAKSDADHVIWQACESITVPPGESVAHSFRWTPRVAGRVALEVRILETSGRATTLTEARRTITLNPPTGQDVVIEKANHVEKRDGRYVTPVTVTVGQVRKERWTAQVKADGRTVGEAATDSRSVTVDCEPWFGYYDVSVDYGGFAYEERIIATVAETDGTDLLVNGEPFIVKGVNVHGMDGSSPERTASMMRIMRDLGFNAWRGDYPARWQVDLAHELNTVYTVLGPFSCTGTPEIFARQDGPPMATSRALSQAFAERYVDSAGVLLWNSCNEVGGETVDFLLSQYPVFRAVDPYDRPVHYANLYGQDFPQGQDVMGVNYYFGRGQRAVDRQPLIERSFDIARKDGLPLIFCEFNSFVGAVHTTGVDAMRDMFAWGVEHGMAGGFQYMKGNSTSHPGVFDNGFNTHRIYDDAIIDAFADARVDLVGSNSDTIHLQVTNKRHCTLRQIRLSLEISGVPVETPSLDDLDPQATVEFDLPVPDAAAGPTCTVEGTLEFITHFGFRCKVPVSLVAAS